MRVVHICKVKGIAGAERHLLILLPGLAEQGIDVHMVVIEEPDEPPQSFYRALDDIDVPYTAVPIRADIDPTLVNRLADVLTELAPDIVHTHLVHADLYGLNAAQRADVPFSISSRHNDNPFRRNFLIKAANKFSLQQSNRVVAISGSLRDFIVDVEGIDPEHVHLIHYGMEPYSYPTDARARVRRRMSLADVTPVIGFFGRLIRQKGVDTLLRAFTLIHYRYPDVKLLIVGDGHQREALEDLAADLRIDSNVIFAGWVDDAPQWMPACDLIVMPSRWEGFGLVALEVMSASRPLIGTNISSLPEIIAPEETGLLVPPDEPADLAQAMIRLLEDPDRAQTLGEQGRQRLIDSFSVQRMIDSTAALYDSIITIEPVQN